MPINGHGSSGGRGIRFPGPQALTRCRELADEAAARLLVHPARCGHDRRVALPAGFVLVTEVFDPAASEAHFGGLLAECDWEEERFTFYGPPIPRAPLGAIDGT